MKLLLLEDEPSVARRLARDLRERSHVVDVVDDGAKAAFMASVSRYDAIVLGVKQPEPSGLSLCRRLRREGSHIPILMLVSSAAVEARIAALDSGADDCQTRPVQLRELLARLRALGRRRLPPVRSPRVAVGHLTIDLGARQVTSEDGPIRLTSREYALLGHLVLHAGDVVSRADLAEHVWESPAASMSNVIDVLIQRLRRKLDRPEQPSLISTRRGEGYMLVATVMPAAAR